MSTISDKIIYGDNGRIFETNASSETELEIIKNAILKIRGVDSVHFYEHKKPTEFSVKTNLALSVKEIEQAVIASGYHAIVKTILG